MQRIINNIQTALSQVASAVDISGSISVADLAKRVQTAIGQLEEVQVNIDYLRKAHIPTVEMAVSPAEEQPTKDAIIDAWEQYCRSAGRGLIPVVAVIMGRQSAELRANDGTKLAVYDYQSKTFK